MSNSSLSFRLELALQEGRKTLQSYFLLRWTQQNHGVDWSQNAEGKRALCARFRGSSNDNPDGNPGGNLNPSDLGLNMKKNHWKLLEQGDYTLWDVDLIQLILEKIIPVESRSEAHFDAISCIVEEARKKKARQQKEGSQTDDATLTASLDKVVKALVTLGLHASICEDLRTKPLLPESFHPAGPPAQEIPAALALKTRGNEEHKAKKFDTAADCYTKALEVEGQTDHARSVLYSNRSASRLEAGKLAEATLDAKLARQLSPLWWRAHYRLGRCYHLRGKLDQAISSLAFADSLSPSNKEVANELASCREKQGSVDRKGAATTEMPSKAEAERSHQRSTWLNDPARKELFLTYRESFAFHHAAAPHPYRLYLSETPQKRAAAAPRGRTLKPITLGDMDPHTDRIYQGRMMTVTVLAEPHWTGSSLAMLVQETSGRSTRLLIYNEMSFRPVLGDILEISNPHHRIARDLKPGLRVDDPRNVRKTGNVVKPCGACGAGEAPYKCQKCGACYCSKDCQTLDWKVYSHKLVCFPQ